MGRKGRGQPDPATAAFLAGLEIVRTHPLFAPLALRVWVVRDERSRCPPDGWCVASGGGELHVHPKRRGTAEEWTWVLCHALLHLGFGHAVDQERPREWNVACCLFVDRFLQTLKLGRPPDGLDPLPDIEIHSEQKLHATFCERGAPVGVFGTAGPAVDVLPWSGDPAPWQHALAEGLSAAVSRAVSVAAGHHDSLQATDAARSPAQRARGWFMDHYPLLGAMAAAFELVEDTAVCAGLQIRVAAVDAEARQIFVNPAAGMDELEARFVIAHELLHVGLRHHERCQGRDPWLWNVACDYVINGWLAEMQVGVMPAFGCLHDPEMKGLSAEAIYDRMVGDLRRYRKLATLRGVGLGDLLEPRPGWWTAGDGLDLDAFYRRCLAQGLATHEEQGRGVLPAGLVEEIRAIEQPPVPWDVQLAQWFDRLFTPLEPRRTYARASRRQAATPHIPRPRVVVPEVPVVQRTFGVVLDTSASMDRPLLARALGAIASYAAARDVPAARVVFCDAWPYDEGYLAVEDIAGRVRVRGRGGTVLQPGIDLLERASDFPKDGPILVITDGACDVLRIRREHAFLVPLGARLPFAPRGPVFRVRP